MRLDAPSADVVPKVAIGALILVETVALAALWPLIVEANDYVQLLSGGAAILAGIDPYDPASWSARPVRVEQLPPSRIFTYPPWAALAFVPFALLPLRVGSFIWAAGGLAVAAYMTVRVARRWSWPVGPSVALAVGSWPAMLVFLQGQWGYVLYALCAGCLLALASRRDGLAGMAWGSALLVKPQLFVVASMALAVWSLWVRRPRVLLAAAATVLAGVIAGTLARPGWLAPYLEHLSGPVTRRPTQQPTLAGLSGDVAGDHWIFIWIALAVALAGVVVVAVRATPRSERLPVAFAATVALSVATAPYSWSYDHYLALLAGVAILGVAAAGRPVARRIAFVATAALFGPIAFVLFESAYIRWHDTLAGLVPVTAIVLLGLTVVSRVARRESS